MSKIEGLVEKWREEAEKAREGNKNEPYPWYRVEADTLDACADELDAALKADAASVGPPPTAPLGGGCGLLRDIEGFSTEALMEQKRAETRRESPDAEPARLWRLQEAADAAGVIIRATCVGYVVRDPDMRKRQYLDPQPNRAEALEAWNKARKGQDELDAALKADAASVGPPPTAPLGGGCGLLRDIEGFSTEALMEQKAAETRRESPDTEAARLWRLLEETYNDGIPVWKTEGGQFMAEVFDGESFLVLPFDTLDKALEAWDKARKVDSTTNEHKPSSMIDFEQGGHKGK